MSADFNTSIKVVGSKEEIVKILETLKYYENERYDQYCKGEPYVDYLEFVYVAEGKKYNQKKAKRLEDIEDITQYVDELKKGEIAVDAMGPYGRGFATLDEIDLFKDIADKLDNDVEFEGTSYGFDIAGRQTLSVEYKNGKLEIDFEFDDDDDDD